MFVFFKPYYIGTFCDGHTQKNKEKKMEICMLNASPERIITKRGARMRINAEVLDLIRSLKFFLSIFKTFIVLPLSVKCFKYLL